MKQVSPSVSNAGSVKELVSICYILIRCLHVQKFDKTAFILSYLHILG